jgi:hypothetical protein
MNTNRTYTADISVLLKPIQFNRIPTGRIGIDGKFTDIVLSKDTWFNFHCSRTDNNTVKIQVEQYGKTKADSDIPNGKDTAIIIEQVKFNGIVDPKFAWAGVYYPEYPDYYIKEQLAQNKILNSELTPYTYLGWNGVWKLEFTLPVYTWIHNTLDLGWIYD